MPVEEADAVAAEENQENAPSARRSPPGERLDVGKGALVRALRMQRDEAQFTRAIAAVARVDSRFASHLVELVLDVARSEGRHRVNVEHIGAPPPELACLTEHSLYDRSGKALGRVDLRFDGGDDFTLLVENKLHGGFGEKQLERYQAALRSLPRGRTRAGLVAITRDVPSYGELLPQAEGWLGAVRWSRLWDRGLADLPISDADVALQWKLLLGIMHEQGDLGLTTVDSDLIIAWTRFEEARKHLVAILGDVRQPALDLLRDRLYVKYRRRGARTDLAATHHFGRREAQPYKREQGYVWTALRVPARINHPTIKLGFVAAEAGKPVFTVEAAVWDSQRRFDDGEPQLKRAARKLAEAGLQSASQYGQYVFWSEHEAEAFLSAPDVPSRLMELIEPDLTAIVESGLLANEFDFALTRGRKAPPKVRGA
jgi:hypothetical protein